MEKVKTNTLKKMSEILTNEPKQLSKAGQWMRENPGGIIVVLDRRAVNR